MQVTLVDPDHEYHKHITDLLGPGHTLEACPEIGETLFRALNSKTDAVLAPVGSERTERFIRLLCDNRRSAQDGPNIILFSCSPLYISSSMRQAAESAGAKFLYLPSLVDDRLVKAALAKALRPSEPAVGRT